MNRRYHMKVDELRTALSGYDAPVLKEIAVTLYKMIPKSRKEDEGLDEILLNFSKEKAKPSKKETTVDFPALENAVETFIGHASDNLYLIPNRIVSKDKRSKWRFEVKRFIKELLAVRGEDSEKAALLLADLYDMMSYACSFWTFSSDDPFSAVGYVQQEFLSIVLSKIFYSGYNRESIKKAVFLTLDSNTDRETWHISLLYCLVAALKTPDTKEMALTECVAFASGYKEYQAAKKAFKYSTKNDDYHVKERNSRVAELYLLLKLSLCEYDSGIAYFWKNDKERNKEITLYRLLRYFLDETDLNALWLREYEKALTRGIEPRKDLQEEYIKQKDPNYNG